MKVSHEFIQKMNFQLAMEFHQAQSLESKLRELESPRAARIQKKAVNRVTRRRQAFLAFRRAYL